QLRPAPCPPRALSVALNDALRTSGAGGSFPHTGRLRRIGGYPPCQLRYGRCLAVELDEIQEARSGCRTCRLLYWASNHRRWKSMAVRWSYMPKLDAALTAGEVAFS